MTQEELDAMMAGDIDLEDEEDDTTTEIEESGKDEQDYVLDAASSYPPPPPSNDNKVVYQLDDVTKESEEKAGEIFDQLDFIGDAAGEIESDNKAVKVILEDNIKLFETLQSSFPNIKSFDHNLQKSQEALKMITSSIEKSQDIGDNSIQIMDIMQYQDIHRQKIERVINVMRSLSNYMNTLFEGQVSDDKRVSSAKHIAGDDTVDVVDNDDIEALIASFGN